MTGRGGPGRLSFLERHHGGVIRALNPTGRAAARGKPQTKRGTDRHTNGDMVGGSELWTPPDEPPHAAIRGGGRMLEGGVIRALNPTKRTGACGWTKKRKNRLKAG